MTFRETIFSVLVGGVALHFVSVFWSVGVLAVPWPHGALRSFPNDRAAVEAIQRHTPENGVYWSTRGVFVARSTWPGMPDKAEATGGRRSVLEVTSHYLVALLLTLTYTRLQTRNILETMAVFAGLAVAAALGIRFSDWSAYGFSTSFVLISASELVVGWPLFAFVIDRGLAIVRGFGNYTPK